MKKQTILGVLLLFVMFCFNAKAEVITVEGASEISEPSAHPPQFSRHISGLLSTKTGTPHKNPLRILRNILDRQPERLTHYALRPVAVNRIVETFLGNDNAGFTAGVGMAHHPCGHETPPEDTPCIENRLVFRAGEPRGHRLSSDLRQALTALCTTGCKNLATTFRRLAGAETNLARTFHLRGLPHHLHFVFSFRLLKIEGLLYHLPSQSASNYSSLFGMMRILSIARAGPVITLTSSSRRPSRKSSRITGTETCVFASLV